MKLQIDCPRCKTRYSVKPSSTDKRFKCKCGTTLHVRSSTSVKNQLERAETEIAKPEGISANDQGFLDENNFLHALSEVQASAQSVEAPMATRLASNTARQDRSFKMTTSMGPYTGRLMFVGITITLLVLVNGLLLTFSFSPITAALIWSPLALSSLIYAAIAVDANKMVVEIDDKKLTVRFLKRLPWPIRDKVIPLESVSSVYIRSRRVVKSFFSNAHSNDTESSYGASRRVEYVYVYCVMGQIKDARLPTCIATFEEQSQATSIIEFVERILL